MSLNANDFVHDRHLDVFIEAAHKYRCHILVRQTGREALRWFGKPGYAGKLANMKAKTATLDLPPYKLAGLVCSPKIHPTACTKDPDHSEWLTSAHLITAGPFADDVMPRGIPTPYMLQTNRGHRHFGCVAWVQNGLLIPRYVHGDYDLHAIVPAGSAFDLEANRAPPQHMTAQMDAPRKFMLKQRIAREDNNRLIDQVGRLTTEVSTFLNLKIGKIERGNVGALYVNHGERVFYKPDFEPALAFLATAHRGEDMVVLRSQAEHETFYAQA